jgi:hypothetical protein
MYEYSYLWWILFGIASLLLFSEGVRNSIKIFVRRRRPYPQSRQHIVVQPPVLPVQTAAPLTFSPPADVPVGFWVRQWSGVRAHWRRLLLGIGAVTVLFLVWTFRESLYVGNLTPPSGVAPDVAGGQWSEWFRNLSTPAALLIVFIALCAVMFIGLIIQYVIQGRSATADVNAPVITHTGPPALQDQYRVRWTYTPFESAAAAFFIVVLSLGVLLGTAYFLYGDTKAFQNLTVWAMRPMFLSMGAVVALIGESIAAVIDDDERLKAVGAWVVINIVGAVFFKWMWFLPPMSGDLFFVSKQGAILPQGLVIGAMVFLWLYAWWKSNGDAKDVLAGFIVVWVVIIAVLQDSAIKVLLH